MRVEAGRPDQSLCPGSYKQCQWVPEGRSRKGVRSCKNDRKGENKKIALGAVGGVDILQVTGEILGKSKR